jgi:long-chain acyl-CoA synthetase
MTTSSASTPSDLHPRHTRTLHGLFLARVALTPHASAYSWHDSASGSWLDIAWQDVAARVKRWQAALRAEGLAHGERVAIMARNSVDWVVFDQAALSLGLVTVPLYTEDRPDNAAYILQDCAARLLLVETRNQLDRLLACGIELSTVTRIVCMAQPGDATINSDARVVELEPWLSGIRETTPALPEVQTDDLASIVYTSGTTGRPKGVMLTHGNLLHNAWAASQCARWPEEAVLLSFLPLSHALERTGGYYLPMLIGARVAYARSIAQLGQDLQEVRPTVLISVPRIYERVYGKIMDGLAEKKPIARKLFNLAVDTGWRKFEWREGRGSWHPSLLLWPLLKRLVADKIVARLGGRLAIAVCGGAALSPPVARLFVGLGVPVFQGYGLTETSPVVTVNRPGDNVPSSIGIPLPGVEVKLGERDELLTKSPCVMKGYWNNPEATAAMFTADGWLKTGDKASVDAWGHYHITGRIKEIIVLSNGEKVPPAEVEMAIQTDPLFDQVMIIGEGKPYLVALAVLNAEHWHHVAQELQFDGECNEAIVDERIEKAIAQRMRQLLKDFPGYAKVRRVTPLLKPWTVDEGLLTPTLKMKRNLILARHSHEVERMYALHAV